VTEGPVVVVGAGPAGLRCAEVLSGPGVRVTLVDRHPTPGGVFYRPPTPESGLDARTIHGLEAGRAARLLATAETLTARVELLLSTEALAVEDGTLAIRRPDGTEARLPFAKLVLAPGAADLRLPFPGAELAGVHGLQAGVAALIDNGRPVGRRTVFLGTGPLLYLAACCHLRAGAEVAAVLDIADPGLARRHLAGLATGGLAFVKGLLCLRRLRAARVPTLGGVRPLSVVGAGRTEGLRCRDSQGREFQVAADAVAVGFGLVPDVGLAEAAGIAMAPDALRVGCRLPALDGDGLTSLADVYVCGDGARVAGAEVAEAAGALTAFAVLIELGHPVTVGMHRFWQTRAGYGAAFRRALAASFPLPRDLGP
jgi:NADPH-dependent 2,4-dienoyl-CoA reductase/sulfur reductase-like enzyme